MLCCNFHMFKRGRYLFFIWCNYITFLNRNLIIVCLSLTQQCVYSVVIDSFHNILSFFYTALLSLCAAPQPGDDLQGAWSLGGQSSSAEGDGWTHHQCEVSALPISSHLLFSLVTCTDLDPSSLQRQRRRSILWASNAGLHQRAADGERLDGPGHPPTGQPVCLVRPPEIASFHQLHTPAGPLCPSSAPSSSCALNDRNASSDRWDVWELF